MLIRQPLPVLVILICKYLLPISCRNHHGGSDFLGIHYNSHQWSSIQKMVDCFTKEGSWIEDKTKYMNDSLSYAKNFERISPCFNAETYSTRNFCVSDEMLCLLTAYLLPIRNIITNSHPSLAASYYRSKQISLPLGGQYQSM